MSTGEAPASSGQEDVAATRNVASNSLTAARWIAISRVTGLARIVVIGAVLGPTYLGNTFQATNALPNYAFEFLTGSLLGSLLIPALVRHIDAGDRVATERVAGGFLGVVVLGALAATLLAIALGPLLLAALSIGVGDPDVAADQRSAGMLLIALLMPQVILYAIAGVGQAVMNAHDRFTIAFAAPVLENLGIVATMAAVAIVYGTGTSIETVSTGQLLLLGLGTTGAVGLHAAAQWWGASRTGVRLLPRFGWRDPEVRALMRKAVPSLGYAGLNSLRLFASTIVANGVAGGVVAFSIAIQFLGLPLALGSRPVSFALLPRLSRLMQQGAAGRFRDEFVQGVATVFFLVIPAAVAYLALARPLAEASAFGEMATGDGVTLLAASIAALALGVLGEAVFGLSTNASYAQDDARSPFRSMVLRSGVSLVGMVVAFLLFEGVGLLVALGLAVTAGNLASGWHLYRVVISKLPEGQARLRRPVLRALAGSAVMVVPAYVLAGPLADVVGGRIGAITGMVLAAALGAASFLTVQYIWRSPELAFFTSGIRRIRTPSPE